MPSAKFSARCAAVTRDKFFQQTKHVRTSTTHYFWYNIDQSPGRWSWRHGSCPGPVTTTSLARRLVRREGFQGYRHTLPSDPAQHRACWTSLPRSRTKGMTSSMRALADIKIYLRLSRSATAAHSPKMTASKPKKMSRRSRTTTRGRSVSQRIR